LWLVAASSLAACGPERTEVAAAPSAGVAPAVSVSRAAVAADYRWLASNADLSKGFSFVWVKGRTTTQVLDLLAAKELERIFWNQLVGSGDGQRGYADRLYFGVTRITDDWVLIVEDNGTLGTTEDLLRPLSVKTTVISNYCAPTAQGRLLVLTDEQVDLDFDPLTAAPHRGARTAELASMITAVGFGASKDPAFCAAAGLALTERLTGIAMTEDLLRSKTYLLSSASRPSGSPSG
jgi:hypothetical protein